MSTLPPLIDLTFKNMFSYLRTKVHPESAYQRILGFVLRFFRIRLYSTITNLWNGHHEKSLCLVLAIDRVVPIPSPNNPHPPWSHKNQTSNTTSIPPIPKLLPMDFLITK